VSARVTFHDAARFPRGFRCTATLCGLKKEGKDLALFASEVPCSAAAVFTRNQVPGAPIVLGRELIKTGRLQAVVVNSKVSNVATGPEGVDDARRMGRAAAKELGVAPELVLVSSTGVIGVRLPIDKIEAGLVGLSRDLQSDPLEGARGIMTTDTHPKAVSVELEGTGRDGSPAVITVVGKGSGMIAPNMATMLVYAFTDAELPPNVLQAALERTADRTFNMLSVDTDTSTSDTCAVLANGLAGTVDAELFEEGLFAACERMTELLARDGEGATRLLRVTVTGAAGTADARTVAKSLVESPLIKTMVFGGDPNVGRILMAVGKCFDVRLDVSRIHARVGGADVIQHGARGSFDDAEVRKRLQQEVVDLEVDLGIGESRARAWGCDLTAGYVEENAAYYSS
jgi:glutamate N-acetyltransferase / amino-acid N-acetyltransferase